MGTEQLKPIENSEGNPGARHRLEINFSPEAYQKLVEIREKSGDGTNSQVIRNALRFYDWILDLDRRNAKLRVVKEGITKEVQLLPPSK